MKFTLQKRIAAHILKCSEKKVTFDLARLTEIKEAITKSDMRSLIQQGAITKEHDKGVSKARSGKIKIQKRKGRQAGQGSRKGSHNARMNKKTMWINSIRKQRDLLRLLREKELLTPQVYQELYLKAKGGFFRSRRHLRLYIDEHNLLKKQAQ